MADRWELVEGKLWQANLIGSIGGHWDVKACCTELSELPSLIGGAFHVLFPFKDEAKLPDLALLDSLACMLAVLVEDGKKVLVNCNAGENRSGLVCGKVMLELGVATPDNVVEMIQAAHPGALWNKTFADHLRSAA